MYTVKRIDFKEIGKIITEILEVFASFQPAASFESNSVSISLIVVKFGTCDFRVAFPRVFPA